MLLPVGLGNQPGDPAALPIRSTQREDATFFLRVLSPRHPQRDGYLPLLERCADRPTPRHRRRQTQVLAGGLPLPDHRDERDEVRAGRSRPQLDPHRAMPNGHSQPEQEHRGTQAQVRLPPDRVRHRQHAPVVEVHLDGVPPDPEGPRLRVVQRRRSTGQGGKLLGLRTQVDGTRGQTSHGSPAAECPTLTPSDIALPQATEPHFGRHVDLAGVGGHMLEPWSRRPGMGRAGR